MNVQEIKETIEKNVPQSTAYVSDPMNDGQHFQAVVVSVNFQEMPLVKQHQLIMRALKDAFAESVHAMALKTFTPEKWEQVKSQFGH
jgi:acid stress-induced BolA-like protein IbaG/YrbA